MNLRKIIAHLRQVRDRISKDIASLEDLRSEQEQSLGRKGADPEARKPVKNTRRIRRRAKKKK